MRGIDVLGRDEEEQSKCSGPRIAFEVQDVNIITFSMYLSGIEVLKLVHQEVFEVTMCTGEGAGDSFSSFSACPCAQELGIEGLEPQISAAVRRCFRGCNTKLFHVHT